MKKSKEKIISFLLIAISIVSMEMNTYAHSGRTDSSGGHKDNKNKSGLGGYHYHCGGHPAHLHTNGVCPYSSSSSSSKSSTSSSASSKSSSSKSTKSTSSSSSAQKTSTVPTKIEATGIKINEIIESMEVGESKTLTATITPDNVTDKSITWKSSDESVVTVTATGEIVAKKAGTADVTATTSNGKTSTIKINIKEEPKPENNTLANIVTISQTNTSKNTTVNSNSETSDLISGLLTLGLLGGGGYLGYKKFKK